MQVYLPIAEMSVDALLLLGIGLALSVVNLGPRS